MRLSRFISSGSARRLRVPPLAESLQPPSGAAIRSSRSLTVLDLGSIVRRALIAWFVDDASSMGAAIAFYTLFAIAPVLLMVIWIAGKLLGPEAVEQHIFTQLQMLLGNPEAAAVRELLSSAKYGSSTVLSTAAGVIAVVVAATSVFAELQNALHKIWHTPRRGPVDGLFHLLRSRLLSFGLVFGVGFLLLVSLMASAGLEGVEMWLGGFDSHWQQGVLAMETALGFVFATLLFAMIFKYVPRENIAWNDVWVGAGVTAALFSAGKLVIVVYLGKIAIGSAYGVAGSFLVLLLWVYYSAQIFLLGAEFTRVFAYEHGSRVTRSDAGGSTAPSPAGSSS